MINPLNTIFDSLTGRQEQAPPEELSGRYDRLRYFIDPALHNLANALAPEISAEMSTAPKAERPAPAANHANQTSEGHLKFIATNALDGKAMDEQTDAQRREYFSKQAYSLAPRREDVINDESL